MEELTTVTKAELNYFSYCPYGFFRQTKYSCNLHSVEQYTERDLKVSNKRFLMGHKKYFSSRKFVFDMMSIVK